MLKVRCSSLGDLFTDPRTKKDKEAGILSQTSQTMVREKWLFDKYGYRKEFSSKELLKGILCEQDSMKLISDVLGGFRYRFTEGKQENEYITGTPDIVLEDCVEDVKTSWDLKTFMEAGMSKAYEMQLRGYMMLLKKPKARLIYSLVETPKSLVQDETRPVFYSYGADTDSPEFQRAEAQIELNHLVVSQIPPKDRVKVFEIERDEEKEQEIIERVINARAYYDSLTLNGV